MRNVIYQIIYGQFEILNRTVGFDSSVSVKRTLKSTMKFSTLK